MDILKLWRFFNWSNNMDPMSILGTPCMTVKSNRIMSGEIWEFYVYRAEKTQCEAISNLWYDIVIKLIADFHDMYIKMDIIWVTNKYIDRHKILS